MSEKKIKEEERDPHLIGATIKLIFEFVHSIPRDMLVNTINTVDKDDAIGPILDPGRFMHGQFESNSRVKARAQKLLELKDLLEAKP